MSKKPGTKEQPKKIYDYFVNEAVALLLRQGESLENAQKQAETFAARVSEKIGGAQLYIPKNTFAKTAQRKAALKAECKATIESVPEFARRNNISTVWAYYILRESTGDSPGTNNSPEVSIIIVESTRMLIKTGVSVQDAAFMSKDFVHVMLAKLGGKTIYIPSAKLFSTCKRVEGIWKQYQAGHELSDIAERYGITPVAVSQLVRARCKESGIATPEERKKKNQDPLILIHKRVLQIAEDYRAKKKGKIVEMLKNVADKIKDVEQAVNQADNTTNESR